MHRFFVTPRQIAHRIVHFDDDQAHQMRRVLRLRPGDRVLALDDLGQQYEVTLNEVSHARATGTAAAPTPATGEPGAHLTLYQSLLRREKFEWVLQKGTEIGVSAFVPVITRRSLVRDAEDVSPEKLGRWRRIIKEAAEQSERGRLPALSAPISLSEAVAGVSAHDITLIAAIGEAGRAIDGILDGRAEVRSIGLFIGPEGGFDPAEVREAESAGAMTVTLGQRIMRTETAALAGATLVMHALGEL